MFSALDNIIFPDGCEVIEIVPSQLYVYPIFKNGSSSLHDTQVIKGWRSIRDHDLAQISEPITVYVRDPRQRFVSGVNTFLQFCQRDNPALDTNTVLHFVKNYLFLNRHYAPQFYWLINLARYSHAPLQFQPLSAINDIVDINDHAGIRPPTPEFLQAMESFPWSQLELYFFLDQILIDHIGHTVTFADIMQNIEHNHPDLYKLVFNKSKQLVNALPKT